MAHVSILRVLTTRLGAVAVADDPRASPSQDCRRSGAASPLVTDMDWDEPGHTYVTLELDLTCSPTRVDVPHHGVSLTVPEVMRLMCAAELERQSARAAEEQRLTDVYFASGSSPEHESRPLPAPEPVAVPATPRQRTPITVARPLGAQRPVGFQDDELSAAAALLRPLCAPYVELTADSLLPRALLAAARSQRRPRQAVLDAMGRASLRWRRRAADLLASMPPLGADVLAWLARPEWRDVCAPGLRDIVDELRGRYSGSHHLPLLLMLHHMGLEDEALPFAVWNALAEREYEPRLPDDIQVADTLELGYVGAGLRARRDVERAPHPDGALLGLMCCSAWPARTPVPAAPDTYVFAGSQVSVFCPAVHVEGLDRAVSGGVWGLLNDPHGRACRDSGACGAANVEYIETWVSSMDAYLGVGAIDSRSMVVRCSMTLGRSRIPQGEWLHVHYGDGFEWS